MRRIIPGQRSSVVLSHSPSNGLLTLVYPFLLMMHKNKFQNIIVHVWRVKSDIILRVRTYIVLYVN